MNLKGDTLKVDGTLTVRYDGERYFITFNSPEESVGALTLGYFVSAPQAIEKVFKK